MADDFHNIDIGVSVRLGVIQSVNDTYVDVAFFDRFTSNPVRCPIPQPYAGRGGGVLVGPEKDTMVLLASGPMNKWFIVGFVPDVSFYTDVDDGEAGDEIRYNETAYPKVGQGEICLKGNVGNRIDFFNTGNIGIDAGIGNKSYDLELSTFAQSFFTRVDNKYTFTEAGHAIEGLVKRNLNDFEDKDQLGAIDFLTGESYEKLLTTIGRSPADETHMRTTTITKETVRNPPLIEKREVVYEYANSYAVRGFDDEARAIEKTDQDNLTVSIENLQGNPFARENRRTDILDLNLRNFNHLIERTEGTVVDIYGNILDINRNIINVPDVENFRGDGNDSKNLRRMYDFLRRSIKYHFEINTRKPISATEPSRTDIDGVAKKHSRFSVDIDGEGLTKINIPASSETGNIPVLSRYFVTRDPEDPDDGSFRDENNRDIKIAQFGAKSSSGQFAGANIDNSDYAPKTINDKKVTVGTAYHDLFNIASSIFEKGKFKDPNGTGGSAVPPLSDTINNKIPEDGGTGDANAGGRSLHMNLDGSMEMSVGADTVDNKSMVMDLQGGTISHFGRDKNNRSIIHQSDGDILIQVGGKGVKDADGRFDNSTIDHPGRIEIHLNRGEGQEPQYLIIDEQGITVKVQGNAVYSSTGNTTISAGGTLLLHGELIFEYGTHDENVSGTRNPQGMERYIARNGNVNLW